MIKSSSIVNQFLKYYLIPFLLIGNGITIKMDPSIHHLFSRGLVFGIMLVFVFLVIERKKLITVKKTDLIFVIPILFSIWMFISTIFVDKGDLSFSIASKTFVFYVLIFLLSKILVDRKQINLIIVSLLIIGLVFSLRIVIEFIQGFEFFKNDEIIRYAGISGSPNLSAYVIAITTVLAFPRFRINGLYIVLICLNSFALFLTYSRSAWLFYAIVVALYFIANINLKQYKWHILVTLGIIIVLGIILKDQIYDLLRMKYGITYRDYLWKAAIDMFADNIWFGVGPSEFQHHIEDYLMGLDVDSVEWRALSYGFTQAHCLLLNNMAELGLVGGALTIYLIILVIKSMFKLRPYSSKELSLYRAVFIAFLVRSLFESGGFLRSGWIAFDIYLWLIIIISLNFESGKEYQNTCKE